MHDDLIFTFPYGGTHLSYAVPVGATLKDHQRAMREAIRFHKNFWKSIEIDQIKRAKTVEEIQNSMEIEDSISTQHDKLVIGNKEYLIVPRETVVDELSAIRLNTKYSTEFKFGCTYIIERLFNLLQRKEEE